MGLTSFLMKAGRGGTKGRPDKLTQTQQSFIAWNAERLGITPEESRKRYFESWGALEGGHAGNGYRAFNDTAYRLFQVFHNDGQAEIYEAYRMHAPMHCLRMLSYGEPTWRDEDVLVRKLSGRGRVDILDFGCGLAQRSRSLAVHLQGKGVPVRLFLADIPTIRKDFLLWLGEKAGTPTTFLPCTRETPIPELPACDLCLANDFFEHVHDPLLYFNRFHAALNPGGLMEADVADHEDIFMHVSPKLGMLRDRLRDLGYRVLVPDSIYGKP